MAEDWEKYAVNNSDEWDQYAVAAPKVNPTGRTSSPEDFMPQELANTKMGKLSPGMSFKQYMTQAQPAFKLALEHPETLVGQNVSPDQIAKTTGGEFSDIYRRAAMPLPGAQSTNIGGQMLPQIAGGAIDLASRPSTAIGGYVAGKAAPIVGKLASSNPAFRRFLQLRVPTLTKKILDEFPMAPIYKEIQGIPRDITKPLPANSPKLVKQGQKLVDAVHETMDNLGAQYSKTLEPFYKTKVADFGGLKPSQLKKVGIDPNKATVEDIWKARWDLLKQVGNPWKKEELLKKTSLKEDELTNLLTRFKAITLNTIDPKARDKILQLDPQFEDAVKAGKGILKTMFDPETGRVNTVRLVNIFKNKADQGTQELFTRFGEYDKRVTQVANSIKSYNRVETIKKVGEIGVAGVAAEQFLRYQLRRGMSSVTGAPQGQ